MRSMKRVRFAKIWFTASVEGNRYRFDGTYKGKQVSWISDDATLYEELKHKYYADTLGLI